MSILLLFPIFEEEGKRLFLTKTTKKTNFSKIYLKFPRSSTSLTSEGITQQDANWLRRISKFVEDIISKGGADSRWAIEPLSEQNPEPAEIPRRMTALFKDLIRIFMKVFLL